MEHEEDSISPRERLRDLAFPFLASIALHAIVLAGVVTAGLMQPEPPPAPFEVELVPPEERVARLPDPPATEAPPAEEQPPVPDTQIVAPPDSPEEAPDEARFLSDRDSRAKEETVKRGQQGPAQSAEDEPGEGLDRTAEAREQARDEPEDAPAHKPAKEKAPGLESLFARPSDMIDQPGFEGAEPDERAPPERQPREYASLEKPGLWGPPGERGALDYLPQIREGRFTLLNTKADIYAPFVRRVGMRVFQLFSRNFRREIFSGSVPQGQEVIEVEAVMSPEGRRLEVILRRREGNLASDRVLLATINDRNFFDENPPANAAAEDGNIHFVFALDSAVWIARDRQTGAPSRGARWVFGAGLL